MSFEDLPLDGQFLFFAPIQSESLAILQDSQMAVAENYLFAPKSRSEELRPNEELHVWVHWFPQWTRISSLVTFITTPQVILNEEFSEMDDHNPKDY